MILNTTVARLRQTTAAIELRLEQEAATRQIELEWQTRTLATFIAATVPVGKGKRNPLVAQAEKIRLYNDGSIPVDTEEEPYDPADPRWAEKVAVRNKVGSYESMMAGMGRR